jgi:DNA-binding MarR family transcriptional regulator
MTTKKAGHAGGPPKGWAQIRALRALLLAAERFRDVHKEFLDPLDLSLAEFDVMATLGNTQGMRMKDVAARMMTSSSTSNVTRICIGLEKRGILERHRSPESDREVIAALTPRGEKMFQELFPKVAAFTREFADSHFSHDELVTLAELLGRLAPPTGG